MLLLNDYQKLITRLELISGPDILSYELESERGCLDNDKKSEARFLKHLPSHCVQTKVLQYAIEQRIRSDGYLISDLYVAKEPESGNQLIALFSVIYVNIADPQEREKILSLNRTPSPLETKL